MVVGAFNTLEMYCHDTQNIYIYITLHYIYTTLSLYTNIHQVATPWRFELFDRFRVDSVRCYIFIVTGIDCVMQSFANQLSE